MVMIVVKSELAVTLTSLSPNLQNSLDFFKLLGQAIQAVFQNPSQNNINNLIAALNNLQKFLNCLDLSPAQKQIGNSIIANLLTILRTTPFRAEHCTLSYKACLIIYCISLSYSK